MRRILFVTLIMLVFAVSVLTGARVLGASYRIDPDSVAGRLAGDTRFLNNVWCWQSICPGSTRRVGTNINQISVYEMTVDFHMRSFSTIVDQIVLREIDLRIGDMILTYGLPDRVLVNDQQPAVTDLCYDDSLCFRIESSTRAAKPNNRASKVSFSPYSNIATIIFMSDSVGRERLSVSSSAPIHVTTWQGFKSRFYPHRINSP
ncbi:MAG: hypothetical protein KF726_09520 [Anaerolineae bacterium]|nr:hypothetical protein [Anaerolineae bacterium]